MWAVKKYVANSILVYFCCLFMLASGRLFCEGSTFVLDWKGLARHGTHPSQCCLQCSAKCEYVGWVSKAKYVEAFTKRWIFAKVIGICWFFCMFFLHPTCAPILRPWLDLTFYEKLFYLLSRLNGNRRRWSMEGGIIFPIERVWIDWLTNIRFQFCGA